MSDAPALRSLDRGRLGRFAAALLLVMIQLATAGCARGKPSPAAPAEATHVGREACKDCHRSAYDAWTGSDHDLAMQEATEEAVLGDFDDAIFEQFGVVSRFYRADGGFRVRTEGPDGGIGDFEIVFTFGVRPLQQYLVRFPGGRLQCLTIAWDTERRRWFSLYPAERIPPGDWLHWTRGAQNWNGMCAECHSTNVRKGYDPDTDAYETTWSEIDVSCEACHGPASLHVEWARIPPAERPKAGDFRLTGARRGMSSREQVESCAPCHSRRFLLRDVGLARGSDLLDRLVPSLLDEHLFFPDGQIEDEVYEYASFLQSRMYRENVRCTDCHDPHTARRRAEGNALCLRCHQAKVYDSTAHHFHERTHEGKSSPGWLCQSCHSPQRVYMGVDWRADHSFRVPRPDLSVTLGTPSACSVRSCHGDRPPKWAADWTAKWYGSARPRHPGEILAAARAGKPEAREDLVRLAGDREASAIVRASAVSLLDRVAGPETRDAVTRALADGESLVRRSAVDRAWILPPDDRIRAVAPLLDDPVEGVRSQAARLLAETGAAGMDERTAAAYRGALAEYERAMRFQSDFPSAAYDLGNLYAALGRPVDAEREYRRSIRIDPHFVRTRVNLALLLGASGRLPEAEEQLRAALAVDPGLAEAHYNLGLLLAETGRIGEATEALEKATAERPGFARAHYNLGLLRSRLGDVRGAEASLARALDLAPTDPDVLFAAADARRRRGDRPGAAAILERWAAAHPDDPRIAPLRAALAGDSG